MTETVKSRNDIEIQYKWDLESMYASDEMWEKDLAKATALVEEVKSYSGRLSESAKTLLDAVEKNMELSQVAEKAIIFAHMKRDEDTTLEAGQARYDKAMGFAAKVGADTAFFMPELIALGEEKIKAFMAEEEGLKLYDFFFESALREEAHVLSPDQEALISQLNEALEAPDDIFSMINNADISFGMVHDDEGNEVELTHGNYINFMESHNREVRKEAYNHMYEAFKALINTLGTTYNYNVKTNVIKSRIRKYDSARAAALYGDNIAESVYDSLIKAVNDNLPALHKYIGLRKKILGVDDLKMYDIYAPLVQLPKKEISYEEAQEMILEALKPMGETYLADIKRGFEERWADVYETPGKRSGAYSFGSYDSKPFVLLNYTNTLQDVFTVIHEFGHSMHSYYSRKNQPYVYGDYTIFTAEVASTVNENLLMKHLIATTDDPETKKYLVNMWLEAFRTTLFRQTMFAEFEHIAHKEVENGGSLTPGWLCKEYDKLNRKYQGDALGEDDMIQYEWARIPHFYSAFYVYKYATGYSAASAISDMILKDGPEDYLKFLTTGGSNYPIELLRIAGVNMDTPEPVDAAMKVFSQLVDEFEKMI